MFLLFTFPPKSLLIPCYLPLGARSLHYMGSKLPLLSFLPSSSCILYTKVRKSQVVTQVGKSFKSVGFIIVTYFDKLYPEEASLLPYYIGDDFL